MRVNETKQKIACQLWRLLTWQDVVQTHGHCVGVLNQHGAEVRFTTPYSAFTVWGRNGNSFANFNRTQWHAFNRISCQTGEKTEVLYFLAVRTLRNETCNIIIRHLFPSRQTSAPLQLHAPGDSLPHRLQGMTSAVCVCSVLCQQPESVSSTLHQSIGQWACVFNGAVNFSELVLAMRGE